MPEGRSKPGCACRAAACCRPISNRHGNSRISSKTAPPTGQKQGCPVKPNQRWRERKSSAITQLGKVYVSVPRERLFWTKCAPRFEKEKALQQKENKTAAGSLVLGSPQERGRPPTLQTCDGARTAGELDSSGRQVGNGMHRTNPARRRHGVNKPTQDSNVTIRICEFAGCGCNVGSPEPCADRAPCASARGRPPQMPVRSSSHCSAWRSNRSMCLPSLDFSSITSSGAGLRLKGVLSRSMG